MRVNSVMLVLVTLGVLGCGQPPGSDALNQKAESTSPSVHDAHDSGAKSQPELYEARGTVLWQEPGRVYLNHEEMPGFMDAMAMGFDVRDPALLEGIDAGMAVDFRVVVEADIFYVDQIYPVE